MASEQQPATVRPSLADWLASVEPPARQMDARRLIDLFGQATGYPPTLWPGSIVGFGRYAYTYPSGHSGESLATGFSPRKAELVIYLACGEQADAHLLDRLGPHRRGKSCLYLRRLDATDLILLDRLIRSGLEALERQWPIHPV